jgi:hypothetical protein
VQRAIPGETRKPEQLRDGHPKALDACAHLLARRMQEWKGRKKGQSADNPRSGGPPKAADAPSMHPGPGSLSQQKGTPSSGSCTANARGGATRQAPAHQVCRCASSHHAAAPITEDGQDRRDHRLARDAEEEPERQIIRKCDWQIPRAEPRL